MFHQRHVSRGNDCAWSFYVIIIVVIITLHVNIDIKTLKVAVRASDAKRRSSTREKDLFIGSIAVAKALVVCIFVFKVFTTSHSGEMKSLKIA